MRTQGYRHAGDELVLSRPTNVPSAIVSLINQHLDLLYRPRQYYRATGVVLSDLHGEGESQLDCLERYCGPSVCAASMPPSISWTLNTASTPCSWDPAKRCRVASIMATGQNSPAGACCSPERVTANGLGCRTLARGGNEKSLPFSSCWAKLTAAIYICSL